MIFLGELKSMTHQEYYFREQTVIWKNPINLEYEYYISVILEKDGYNRFDYAAFNYGSLPGHQDWGSTAVTVYSCRMKPLETPLDSHSYLVDDTNFHPEYTTYKSYWKNVF
jgi:hypothetical protein